MPAGRTSAEVAARIETSARILILDRLKKVPVDDWEQNPTLQKMVDSKWYSVDSFSTRIRIPGQIVEFSIGLATNDYTEIPVLTATGHDEHGKPVVLNYWLAPLSPEGSGTRALFGRLKKEIAEPQERVSLDAQSALRQRIVDYFGD